MFETFRAYISSKSQECPLLFCLQVTPEHSLHLWHQSLWAKGRILDLPWWDLCFSLAMSQRLAWRCLLCSLGLRWNLTSRQARAPLQNLLFWTTYFFHTLSIFFFLFTHSPSGRFICILPSESGGICSKTCLSLSSNIERPDRDTKEVQIYAGFIVPDESFICVRGAEIELQLEPAVGYHLNDKSFPSFVCCDNVKRAGTVPTVANW